MAGPGEPHHQAQLGPAGAADARRRKHFAARQIEMARETLVAIQMLREGRTRDSLAAFHELHAQHMRELGNEQAAERAEARARAVRQRHPPGALPPRPGR